MEIHDSNLVLGGLMRKEFSIVQVTGIVIVRLEIVTDLRCKTNGG